MSRETAPGTSQPFHLIALDRQGCERREAGGLLASEFAREEVRSIRPTDVFLLCHGWMGDFPAARRQYGAWVSAMAECRADVGPMERRSPGFRPLILGIHWPSLPWGDEVLDSPDSDRRADLFARRFLDTPPARAALTTIFRGGESATEELPSEIADAYASLDRETGLGATGPGSSPGEDREPFDARAVYRATLDEAESHPVSFGLGAIREGLLSPLRVLSFWAMKDRARIVGEAGVSALLTSLQGDAPAARFHLMGHSFGCISACAALGGRRKLIRPIESLSLIQGAMSLWSFCSNIPVRAGTMGYFYPIVRDRLVNGPIVATLSEHDRAVGTMYPIAAGAARQVAFSANSPRYGGLGACGIRGPVPGVVDREMRTADDDYDFAPGGVTNLESSRVICRGSDPFTGAHSDFCRPEVAHAVWSAALPRA